MKYQFSSDESLEIIVREKGTRGIPFDCAFELKLQTGEFSGCTSCWVNGYELKGFCNDLTVLSKTLKETVQLSSESPGELDLKISPVNSLGLFSLEITLGMKKVIGRSIYTQSVSNAFELEVQKVLDFSKMFLNYIGAELND